MSHARRDLQADDGIMPESIEPIIRSLEWDLRVRVDLDVARLLEDRRVDATSGEPSVEQLMALVHAILEHHLRAQAFIVTAHMTWLVDGESLAPREWSGR